MSNVHCQTLMQFDGFLINDDLSQAFFLELRNTFLCLFHFQPNQIGSLETIGKLNDRTN